MNSTMPMPVIGEEKLGVGFDNVRLKLKEDKKLLEAIKKKTQEAADKKMVIGGGSSPIAEEE